MNTSRTFTNHIPTAWTVLFLALASTALAQAPTAPAKPPQPKNEILLNFQGAQLSDVLNYLSEAAGFVIVQEAPITGTVNIVSRQPIGPEEAVDLLNTVLVEAIPTTISAPARSRSSRPPISRTCSTCTSRRATKR